MKVRDSGMPDEEMWQQFFDPEGMLRTFGIGMNRGELAEFGCGYGTFTMAAARAVKGTVFAFDIEPELVRMVKGKCLSACLHNVRLSVRDFVGQGTGLPDEAVDAALLFNILHHAEPVALMWEARRILKTGGVLAVIHWNHDPATPRGPSMDIRPRPEQCIAWGREAGFTFHDGNLFNFPPYHYGLLFTKGE